MRYMLKCAILDDYQKVARSIGHWESLKSAITLQTFHHHFDNPDDLVRALYPQDILVVMRERTCLDATLLSQLPHLKLIVTSGMRNAAIDLDYAGRHGITVCGTDHLAAPAAELTWGLILGLARHIIQENTALQNHGAWQSTLGMSLAGKQLGILGLGKIGTQVANIGKAFGMNVAAWSQNLTRERTEQLGITLAPSKMALLQESDFVSIHLVLSERTRNLIQAADLARMRPSAYLINTARAPIVNEHDLITALQEHHIAGAGLDVFEQEPLHNDHPFRTLRNVLATPHIGYVTHENYTLYFEQAVEDIAAFLKGQPIRELTPPYCGVTNSLSKI